MATAGLQLLESSLQDQILDSCRWVLQGFGFKFRNEWASVISGMAFNFLFISREGCSQECAILQLLLLLLLFGCCHLPLIDLTRVLQYVVL